MARHSNLSRRRRYRLWGLGAAVLLAHGLAIDWFARHHVQASLLRPMVAPMYTRVLAPQAPPTPAPAPAPTAAVRPAAPAVRAIEPPPAAAVTASAEPAAPADARFPEERGAKAATTPEADANAAAESAVEPAAPPAPETEVASASPPPAEPEAAPADRWPSDTRLSYRLSGNFRGELHGDAQVQWQREGPRYQVRVEVDLTLLATLVLTSQGQVGADGLMPEVYEERRSGKTRSLRIGEREVVLTHGEVLPRPPGVQDTASQFVELSHRFSTGQETLEVGRSVSFWMARPAAVDLWTYDVVGRETLRTARLGEVEAFHLKPRPLAKPRGNITVEMWFAPSLQYLPVRIRVNMGDEAHVDLLVDTIEQR